MTVKELIEELSKMPMGYIVKIYSFDYDEGEITTPINSVGILDSLKGEVYIGE